MNVACCSRQDWKEEFQWLLLALGLRARATPTELESVSSIELLKDRFVPLQVFRHFKGLKELRLIAQQLTTLSGLAESQNLEVLHLAENRLSSLQGEAPEMATATVLSRQKLDSASAPVVSFSFRKRAPLVTN